jgi:hypothetical protein
MVLDPSPRNQVGNKVGHSPQRWHFVSKVLQSHYLQPDPHMSNVKSTKMEV